MLRNTLGLLLLLFSILGLAQDSHWKNGLAVNLNIPTVNNANSNLATSGGFGLEYNQLYAPRKFGYIGSGRAGYNMLSYSSSEYVYKMRSHNAQLGFGIKKHFQNMDSFGLNFHIIPSYSFVFGSDQTKSQNIGSTSRIPFADSINNAFDIGLSVGAEILSKPHYSFEMGYQLQLLATNKIDFIDATPHKVYLRINLNFGELPKAPMTKYQEEIAKELEEFSMGKDTLFVLNYSCKEKLTDEVLAQLFFQFYRFSAFKIIQPEDIVAIQEENRVKFFAIVGNHYAALNEPESIGIFLLDKNMKLVEFPYPVLTMYSAFGDKCMNDLIKVGESISWFSRRLKSRSLK